MLTYFDDNNSLVINMIDDGEIYELPNQIAITTATEILKKLLSQNLFPDEIDSDVLGGIAIWFINKNTKIWISVMNTNKTPHILYKIDNIYKSEYYNNNSINNIIEFLKSES